MGEPRLTETFIVDLDDEEGNFISIQACTVYNVEGDLIFVDDEGTAIDMVASGYWKRCKLAKEL